MKFLKVSLSGLRNRLHYTLHEVDNNGQVKLIIPHIQMLIGNYFTGYLQSNQETQNCPLCDTTVKSYVDSLAHLLSSCCALIVERERLMSELDGLCNQTKNEVKLSNFITSEE